MKDGVLPRRVIDLTGQKFGYLTVLKYAGINKYNHATWQCICECGNQKIIEGQSLREGNTRSCGCLYIKNANKLSPINRSRKHALIVCGIYKITNPNGEVYIGGSRTIYRRWLRHREARKKIKIHLSIKEYGWNKHKFEIIHQLPHDITNETLIRYEQLYMDLYRDCGSTMLNVKDAGSKAKFSDESKARMSLAQLGKTPWNKGLIGGNKMAAEHNIKKRNSI